MGGCASKPRELKGEMDASLIRDKHGEREEGKGVVKEAAGGQREQENGRRSLGFLLKELEAKEAEESEAEDPMEGSEGEIRTIVPQKEDMELPVSSLVNAA